MITDAVVLDLDMPHVDGWKVLEVLGDRDQTVPVVVTAARGGHAEELRALRAGRWPSWPSRTGWTK